MNTIMRLANTKSIKTWVTMALESPATSEHHDFLHSFSFIFLNFQTSHVFWKPNQFNLGAAWGAKLTSEYKTHTFLKLVSIWIQSRLRLSSSLENTLSSLWKTQFPHLIFFNCSVNWKYWVFSCYTITPYCWVADGQWVSVSSPK